MNAALNETFHEYSWEKSGEFALLKDSLYGIPQKYSKETIEAALKKIRESRDWYFTEEAWIKQIKKFEKGLELFS